MNMSRFNCFPIRFSLTIGTLGHFAFAFFCFAFFSPSAHAAQPDCSAGTLVTVVAHLDDDLLFVEPGISERLQAGWCVTTVHLIGGANGANFAYVQKREEGSRLAYARMAGVRNEWDEATVRIAGNAVFQLTLKAQPKVKLLELRLPGGAVRGGRVPLALLWDQGATITSYPMGHGEGAPARYTRDSLSAVLKAILQSATEIDTLNPDTVPFIEHPDHIYSARITRHVAQTLGRALPIAYFVTYPTGNWPSNVYGKEAQQKRDIAATYFSIDGGDFAHVFGEYQWDGDWVLRKYAHTDTTTHAAPDFVARPSVLFNAASSQCLTSSGASREPVLAACNDTPGQQWTWEPRPTYAGNQHNAALVSAATGQCVAENDGTLTEEPCDQWDASQRWTPWDFGLIFTPSRRCLGEENDKLNIRGCASLTTRYRWTARRPSWATDLRLAGPMYADVAGHGQPSVVYVERRADGPGFDIHAQDLTVAQAPELWYANSVPFDSKATKWTCEADTLCFDSARFLTGNFDNDSRADLMVVTPRNGGSALWLLRSNGSGFSAPVLWYQSDGQIPAERTQQFVAIGSKVLAAVQRAGSQTELWVIGADKAGRIGQTKVLDDARLKPDLHLLATNDVLFAIQPTDNNRRLEIFTIGVTGTRLTLDAHALLPTTFNPEATKFALDSRSTSAASSIILTVPHLAPPGGVDVWKWNIAQPDSPPAMLGWLRELRWQDATPALPGNGHTLAFYERADVALNNTLYSAGDGVLLQYAVSENQLSATPVSQSQFSAKYSETLWLERLTQ